MRTTTLALAALLGLALALPAQAGWTNDPISGMVTVCDAPGHQRYPRICNLAGNRTFIAWQDERTVPVRAYYQVLDPAGNALLAENGVPLIEGNWFTALGGNDNDDAVIPDGLGGCIVVFMDERDGSWDVYGQRVDSLGNRMWGAEGLGLVIWPGPSNQDAGANSLRADSLGNFFCSSVVIYTSTFYGMYMQKFRADGSVLWGPIGALVRSPLPAPDLGGESQATVPDMAGGVIDVWEDYHFGSENVTLYFQHLDADGNPLLPLNGIPVRNLSGQACQGILDHGVPDGQGGGIWARTTAWSVNWFYLFRLNSQGQMLWEWTTGNMSAHGFGNQLLRHPADGTIWFRLAEDVPGHHGTFLYRFNVEGTPLFGNRGLRNGAEPMIATADAIIDGTMRWKGVGAAIRTKIWAERIAGTGHLLWNVDVALGGASPGLGPCFAYPVAASDGAGGAVFAFEDHNATNDIAAQRVLWNGRLGAPDSTASAPEAHREPLSLSIAGGHLRYILPTAGQVKIELFDLLGRRAALILETFQDAGEYAVPFDDRALPSGIYFLRLTTPAGAQTAKVALIR
ncbi:MAG TPA: T9SS type A sorting domain-containing protein [bacterium]|jgi:hypothetical protein